MKCFLSAALAVGLMSGTALASDVLDAPYHPAYASRAYDWSGFYAGANVGWIQTRFDDFDGNGASLNIDGFSGGGQAGFNFQRNQLVFGVEGDFNLVQDDTGFSFFCPAATCGTDTTFAGEVGTDWNASISARLGYALNSWLFYGTGGYAWARLKTEGAITDGGGTTPFSASATAKGWVAGLGAENAVSENMSVKFEYLHMEATNDDDLIDGSADTFRVGVNFHLNPPRR